MFRILSMSSRHTAEQWVSRFAGIAEFDELPHDRETVLKHIENYHGYIATLAFRADREFLDRAVNLKAIFTASTGTDHIDLDYCAHKGIHVFSMKEDREFLDNVTATAELALALLLGVLRKLPWGFDAAKQGIWARDRYRGHQLSGMTCGILGYGRLGTIFAQYAKALRMNVIACDLLPMPDAAVEMVSYEELLARSDILSIHVHLTPENVDLINDQAFAKMKDNVVIINTSRGAVINEPALLRALLSGKVRAAGLDVINGEWDENLDQHPLIKYAQTHENLLISPHVGGVTYESQDMANDHTLEKVCRYVTTGRV